MDDDLVTACTISNLRLTCQTKLSFVNNNKEATKWVRSLFWISFGMRMIPFFLWIVHLKKASEWIVWSIKIVTKNISVVGTTLGKMITTAFFMDCMPEEGQRMNWQKTMRSQKLQKERRQYSKNPWNNNNSFQPYWLCTWRRTNMVQFTGPYESLQRGVWFPLWEFWIWY